MKKLLFTFIGFLFFAKAFSQNDSVVKYRLLFRPFVELGVAFIQNDQLKEMYNTTTMVPLAIGFRIGNPYTENLLPYVKYSRCGHTIETKIGNQRKDSTLSIRQFNFGFEFPVSRFGAQMLKARAAPTYAWIDDDMIKNSGDGYGIQLGIGWEGKMDKRSRVSLSYTYDLIKFMAAEFRDYDLGKLTIAMIF